MFYGSVADRQEFRCRFGGKISKSLSAQMRIIAGTKRGMKLFSPKTLRSRPITDRVKESLFNILYKYDLPSSACVADLFCGVGSLGLEALSRAAKFVVFIEHDPKVVVTLNRNIEKAGFIKQSKVIRANAFKVGASVELNERKYDLVFVDPPYAETIDVSLNSQLGRLLQLLGGQINKQCIIVVRTHRSTSLLDQYGQLRVLGRRQWGTMAITMLQESGQ
jgi:16S rRNA (guanine966-N2)-methyltransferase